MESLDGNSILRSASLADYPPEAITYKPGDNVLVWTSTKSDEAQASFQQAVVTEGCEQSRRMRVRMHDGTLKEYGNGASKRGRFTLALPNLGNRRSRLHLYVINRWHPSSQDARHSWIALLLGPGARPIGDILATRLRCIPDADESDLYRYYLYLHNSPTKEAACQSIARAAESCLWSFLTLQALLESYQELKLVANHDGTLVLRGPCSAVLVPALKKHLGVLGCARSCDTTKVAYSKREKVLLTGAALTLDRAREAVVHSLGCACIPSRLLDGEADKATSLLRSNAAAIGWRCREEGPAARHAQILADSEEGYSCPACTLAVHGPRVEAVCLLNYARFHAEVPSVKHAEIFFCARASLSPSDYLQPATKAATAWASYGIEDARGGKHFLPWVVKQLPSCNDEEAYRDLVLSQWSIRNLKRKLEGEMACVRPMRYTVELDLTSVLDFIEYTDFRTTTDVHPLPRRGWCGLINPLEWIEAPHLKVQACITIWPQEGVVFQHAQHRPQPRARMNARVLRAASSEQKMELARAFVSSEVHLNLPGGNNEPVTGPVPLHLCASGHPESVSWAQVATRVLTHGILPSTGDIEEIFSAWKRNINNADRACCLCMTCKQATQEAIPGFWDMQADLNAIVCSFPCSWRPCRRSVCTASIPTYQLPPCPLNNVTRDAACLTASSVYRRRISEKFAMEIKKDNVAVSQSSALDPVSYWVSVLAQLWAAPRKQAAKPDARGTSWPLHVLEKLATLPQNSEECQNMSLTMEVLLSRIRDTAYEMKVAAVKAWLQLRALPLRILSRELSTEKGKYELVSVLARCVEVSDLKIACCFFFTSRSFCNCIERGWDSQSISRWILNTIISRPAPWSISESMENMALAIASQCPAKKALILAESHVHLTATAWATLWTNDQDHSAAPTIHESISQGLVAKEYAQLHAPMVGSSRWFDSHDHPEHAALLLDHSLRELISALLYICVHDAASPFVELKEDDVPGVLRGDPEYLHSEDCEWEVTRAALAQRMSRLLTGSAEQDLPADVVEALVRRLENILSEGSGSTTLLTAECLPRKSFWLIRD